jgi:hypothetical protein
MIPGISGSILSWLTSSAPRCLHGIPTMTRMKRMRKTAATRKTTASRPLFRTKIGPALARTSTMDDVQREEQQVPMGGTRRSAVSVKTSIVRE